MRVVLKNGSAVESVGNIGNSKRGNRANNFALLQNNEDFQIGEYYTEIATKLIWKLADVGYFDVELENYDTTYWVGIDEFKEDFKIMNVDTSDCNGCRR